MKVYRFEVWGFSVALALIIAVISFHTAIEKEQVIKKISTTHKVVAITIDDGPNYNTTPAILNVLRDKQVKVTFFVLGRNAEKHPEILAQLAADGHEIGAHGYSHEFFTRMSLQAVEEELERCEALITKSAPKPYLLRPPGGGYSDSIVMKAQKRGYRTILWSVDPGDWRRPPVGHVVNNVLENVFPGSIVLLHDGQDLLPTPQALAIIIDKLRDKGYQIVTVGELLTHEGK